MLFNCQLPVARRGMVSTIFRFFFCGVRVAAGHVRTHTLNRFSIYVREMFEPHLETIQTHCWRLSFAHKFISAVQDTSPGQVRRACLKAVISLAAGLHAGCGSDGRVGGGGLFSYASYLNRRCPFNAYIYIYIYLYI